MNSCRRIACSGWRSGLNTVFSRVTAPSLSRSQATSAALDPDTGEKPRLRAIDLAKEVQQEKTKPPVVRQRKKPQAEASGPAEAETPPPPSGQQKRVMELKRFTLQLQQVHPNVLAKHLLRGVLYQDKDVVITNKPYGVPVKDDCGGTSISSVLPVLSKMMDGLKMKSDSQLIPCLRLEKETTGVFLLARSEEVVQHIHSLVTNNQVQRKYWVVILGVPVPSEGVIDIPIIEKEVPGPRPHYKMALSPLFRVSETGEGVTKVRANRQSQPAVTKYKVLGSGSGCSLVELQPLTEVKHQMRVHMALGLTCPILGDHKYSHSSILAPQKLPDRVLGKLGLEQSKVRYLPLHVLARQLTLAGNTQDINVTCPLPKYFKQTLKQLHLTFLDEKDQP